MDYGPLEGNRDRSQKYSCSCSLNEGAQQNLEVNFAWMVFLCVFVFLLLMPGTNVRLHDLSSPLFSLVTFHMLGSGCLKDMWKDSTWKTTVCYRTFFRMNYLLSIPSLSSLLFHWCCFFVCLFFLQRGELLIEGPICVLLANSSVDNIYVSTPFHCDCDVVDLSPDHWYALHKRKC